MKRKINNNAGSTWTDTLAAIIVITMIITTSLMAIVPSINKARAASMQAICANNMKQVAAAMQTYADEYNGFLPWYGGKDPCFPPPYTCPATNTSRDSERHSYVTHRGGAGDEGWMDITGKPYPMRLGCLYAGGIVNDARIFYCPADERPQYRYESYIDPAPPNTSYEWGTLPQNINVTGNQWVRVGYTYFPIDLSVPRDLSVDKVPQWTARRYDDMEANIPFMTDLIWNTTANTGMEQLTHKEENLYALNAVFKDGHIVFVKGNKTNETKAPYGPFNEYVWKEFGNEVSTNSNAWLRFYYLIFSAIKP